MKIRTADIELVCAMAFRRWCAEELIDPRLEDVLEEAFIAGFIACNFTEPARFPEPAHAS